MYFYPAMTKTLGGFKVKIEAGRFQSAQIVVMLGQNGTGKTTFIKVMAGVFKPDDDETELPRLNISYKPQTIAPKFQGLVRELLYTKLKDSWQAPLFKTEVMNPLDMDSLLDNEVQNLSGGEL
jgi:ATP-binding cassette, sub-family E, member 1